MRSIRPHDGTERRVSRRYDDHTMEMRFGDENGIGILGIDHGGNWIWIDPLSYGMDTIYNLNWGIQHGSCVLGQLGLADKLWIGYTTKEARERLQSFCEMEIQDWYCGETIQLVEMDGI